jgi:peptide/nickel transport system permease protein
MRFVFVTLATDVLIYLLVAVAVGFGVYASRHEHLRGPWRQVARRPLAMAALVVLVGYAVVGLLDSVHFRERIGDAMPPQYSVQVRSLLDVLCAPLREHTEITYSAPFAVHAFTRETIELPGGRRTREYRRLLYGGAHLKDPAERAGDIAARAGAGAAAGVGLWGLIALAVLALQRRREESLVRAARRLFDRHNDIPWRTILATIGVVAVTAVTMGYLSLYYHVLGTDQVGQDVFYRSLKSIRTGLVIGTLTTLVMLPFAVLFGIMAGYFRGWVDDVVQYTYTTLSSIPGVLLIAAAILSLQVYIGNHADSFDNIAARADLRLLFLCLILGVTSWTSLCRLLRGETLKLREIDYVQAAQALGAGHGSIMARHLVPNVMHIVLITVVLDFSGLVLAEAVLSYVGVGVDPTTDSWGNMINGARLEMARDPMVWWGLAAAFTFMFGLVLAANLFADAVRDAFDPRLRR